MESLERNVVKGPKILGCFQSLLSLYSPRGWASLQPLELLCFCH